MSDTVMDDPALSPASKPTDRTTSSWRSAPGLKIFLVGGLFLAMLIPQLLISDVIRERESYQREVGRDLGRSWGPPQRLLGPVLMIPTRTPVPKAANEIGPTVYRRGTVAVLPSRLEADIRLSPERRRRGLFEAVVFGAEATLAGSFAVPALTLEEDTELLWREAHLVAGAADLRSGAEDSRLSWDGRPLSADSAFAGSCGNLELLRWNLGLDAAPAPDRPIPFTGATSLRGTGSFHLLTAARRTELSLAAPWPTPSFTGTGLPVRSEVTNAGFTARWSEGGAGSVLRLSGEPCLDGTLTGRSVGVELLEAVPTYRMVSRASKYAAMFLALSFLTYALFELLARIRIHLVQYGLLGASVVLFPLLLLAFGEPLGFAAAYAISAGAVAAQASAYTLAVTKRPRLAAIFAGVLATLFAFLYVVLSLESYALLTGAVALFAALSLVMVATRRVEWSRA